MRALAIPRPGLSSTGQMAAANLDIRLATAAHLLHLFHPCPQDLRNVRI